MTYIKATVVSYFICKLLTMRISHLYIGHRILSEDIPRQRGEEDDKLHFLFFKGNSFKTQHIIK